jgi:hypothetical protein
MILGEEDTWGSFHDVYKVEDGKEDMARQTVL